MNQVIQVNPGEKYHNLTVESFVERNQHGRLVYKCICDCGNTKNIEAYRLKSEKRPIKSCGCIGTNPDGNPAPNAKDKTGKIFGNLKVLSFSHNTGKPYYRKFYNCECILCGTQKTVNGLNLRKNKKPRKKCSCKSHIDQIQKHGRPQHKRKWGESSFNAILYWYKRGAKQRNLDFNLTVDEFKILTKRNCYYCGYPPIRKTKNCNSYNGYYLYNGVDRVDNNKGYDFDNCVACCEHCNKMKHAHSKEFFLEQVERIYNHMKRKEERYAK